MAEVVHVPAEALVIRFRPTAPDRVLASAVKEFRRADHYGCSVFAGASGPEESEQQLIARLLDAAELLGMDPERNPKYWVCARAEDLVAEGFVFLKDGEAGEPDEHYCVSLGSEEPSDEVVTAFLSHFDRLERR